jgi:hypothetical protein
VAEAYALAMIVKT